MLTAFTSGLFLVTISELGDKTFFISVLLAMQHARRWVFLGAIAALATMTFLSVLLGQFVSFLPAHYVKWAAVSLFIGLGLKLLYDGYHMSSQSGEGTQEAQELLATCQGNITLCSIGGILSKAFSLTFLAEWGDRTQFTTTTLAAAHNPVGVALGATLGHAICAAIAVFCGRAIAGRISDRIITLVGGGLFLLFGVIAGLEMQ
jgi:putative Ca2+/H+ antiporter (TMEM165/GDT1 family)